MQKTAIKSSTSSGIVNLSSAAALEPNFVSEKPNDSSVSKRKDFEYFLIFASLAILVFIEPIYYRLSTLLIAAMTLLYAAYKRKIYLNLQLVCFASLYSLIALASLGNKAFLIDFRYHATILIFVVLFYNFYRAGSDISSKIFITSSLLTLLVGLSYLVYFSFPITSPYARTELAAYQAFRVQGPALEIGLLAPIAFLNCGKKIRGAVKILTGSFIFAALSAFLSGSATLLFLTLIVYVSAFITTGRSSIVTLLSAAILSLSVISFAGTEEHRAKALQVFAPLEAPTVRTRISDIQYTLDGYGARPILELVFGQGIGTTTWVLRRSPFNNSYEYREFLEIDNGLVYVFNRTGFLGLILLVLMIFSTRVKRGTVIEKGLLPSIFLIAIATSIAPFLSPFYALVALISRQGGK